MTLDGQPEADFRQHTGNADTDSAPAKPVRNKGGRPKGSRNKITADLAKHIREEGRPIELLCDIARGRRIKVGNPDNPNAGFIWQHPSLDERRKAAESLARKIMADVRATELSGPDGAPLGTGEPTQPRELAKAVLAALVTGAPDAPPEEKPPRQTAPASETPHPHISPAPGGELPPARKKIRPKK